jgi:hypothetical protein
LTISAPPRARGTAIGFVSAVIAAVGALASPWVSPASAQTVDVPCSTSTLVSDLLAAYNAHGTTETLSLAAGCTYTIPAPASVSPAYYNTDGTPFDWYGPSGLPAIDGTITIDGNGATLERSGTAAPFRFFYVAADPADPSTQGYATPGAGSLTLHDLTLTGGLARGGDASGSGGGAGMGGAIFDQGQLTLNAVTLTANTAQGGQGLYNGSTLTGGGGIGSDGTYDAVHNAGSGGGFGPGSFGGAQGGAGTQFGFSGGGGGFGASENGHAATMSAPGAGGGPDTGLGGTAPSLGIEHGAPGGDGSGGGAATPDLLGTVLSGGAFGEGGVGAPGGSGGGGAGVGGGSSGDGNIEGGGAGFGGGGGQGGHTGGFGGGGGGFGGGSDGSEKSGPHMGVTDGGGGAGMGGAVFVMQGHATVENSTLTSNEAIGGASSSNSTATAGDGLGGAIFNLSGAVSLTGDTISGNTAAEGGGGIYNVVYDSATARTASVTLADSIVHGNGTDVTTNDPADTTAGPNLGQATVDVSAPNIIGASSSLGAAKITGSPSTANPQLGALSDNGGPGMKTEVPGPTSPALGAGAGCLATDERGDFRPHDGCDLGAVEVTGLGAPTASITTPATGATYTVGQTVTASYTCADPHGPGISSCTGTVPTGQPIDTTKAGTFTFTVTATSTDGQTASASSSYTIAPAPPPPTHATPKVTIRTHRASVRHGRIKITLSCSNADCNGTLTLTVRRARTHHGHRHPQTVVLARTRFGLPAGQRRTIAVHLRPTALRLLHRARHHRLRAHALATVGHGKATSGTIVLGLRSG